ncbi:hypothetical protein ANCDUO_02861 [Ancylostoma duodenale]|uniref:Peptidase A2 domain-containing protein n=1 Tax=Ancylostoma duodenale TaxID=51022 RepID=A0A0C2H5J3_9BILA|nr:hypothetical protein ANCDUO_02861 [Ancylostoma duodenale]
MFPLQKYWRQRRIVQLVQTPIQRTASLPTNFRSTRQTIRSDAIVTVSSINCNQYRRYSTVKVSDQFINFQVDSASDLTVINKETWQLMGEKELQPPSPVAHSVSGNRIQLLGQRQCTYSFHDASAQGSFYMANTPSNLLGAE